MFILKLHEKLSWIKNSKIVDVSGFPTIFGSILNIPVKYFKRIPDLCIHT